MTRDRAVFLDACVLYPPLLRRLLIGAAEAGLYRPLWSRRVLDEWLIAVARKEPEGLAAAEAARAAMAARFPEAEVPPDAGREAAIALPDPADAHVLAAAAGAAADTLLTLNLRDFPRRTALAHALDLRHPDGFLWELWSGAPEALEPVLAAALPERGPAERRAPLKRARLPRFAKAQAGERPTGGARAHAAGRHQTDT